MSMLMAAVVFAATLMGCEGFGDAHLRGLRDYTDVCAHNLTQLNQLACGSPLSGHVVPEACGALCSQLYPPWWSACKGLTRYRLLDSIGTHEFSQFFTKCNARRRRTCGKSCIGAASSSIVRT